MQYDLDNPNELIQTSKYNDAGLSIARLNDSWILCKHYMRTANLNGWKTELDNISLELHPDIIKQKNTQELLKKDNLFLKRIAHSKTRVQLAFNLKLRHRFLREIQDIAGKAGVYVDENEELE